MNAPMRTSGVIRLSHPSGVSETSLSSVHVARSPTAMLPATMPARRPKLIAISEIGST